MARHVAREFAGERVQDDEWSDGARLSWADAG